MTQPKLEKVDIQYFRYFLVLALAVFLLVSWGFLPTIILAIIFTYIFRPMYLKIYQRTQRESVAVTLTVIAIFVLILIPITLAASITVGQIISFTNDIRTLTNSGNLNLEIIISSINQVLAQVPFLNLRIAEIDLLNAGKSIAQPLGTFLFQSLFSVGSSAIEIFTKLIVFVSIVSALLPRLPEAIRYFKDISPLPDHIDDTYINRFFAMATSMLQGVFIVAIIQGVVSGLTYHAAGVSYVFFWSLLATLASVIPLGAGFVSIPIGLILIVTGNEAGGLLVLLMNIIVVSNIDNVLRPRLASKDAHLHPVLTLLGILGGAQLFGFLGIILGPILMIFSFTTMEIYKLHHVTKK